MVTCGEQRRPCRPQLQPGRETLAVEEEVPWAGLRLRKKKGRNSWMQSPQFSIASKVECLGPASPLLPILLPLAPQGPSGMPFSCSWAALFPWIRGCGGESSSPHILSSPTSWLDHPGPSAHGPCPCGHTWVQDRHKLQGSQPRHGDN